MTSTLTLIAAFVLPRFILLAWEFSGHPCPFSTSIVLSVATHTLLYITTVIYAGIFFFRPIFMYLLYDSKKLGIRVHLLPDKYTCQYFFKLF